MNKLLGLCLIGSLMTFGSEKYSGSTTASVTLAGAIIKAQGIEVEHKYKRKYCPVCKGTGYYISGDGIKKVDCGYCEPDKKDAPIATPNKVITHSPIIIKQNCPDGKCPQIK